MTMGAMLAMEQENHELSAVRYWLRQWVAWRRGWAPDNGHRHSVPWLDQIKGHIDSYAEDDDYDIRIRAHALREVDQAIDRDLSTDHRHAVMVVYLREIGPAVWQSGRKPMHEIRALCQRAELALVPSLRRRNVV
jgi:hypothetical protein